MSLGYQTMESRSATAQDPIDFAKVGAKPAEVEGISKVRYWKELCRYVPCQRDGPDRCRPHRSQQP